MKPFSSGLLRHIPHRNHVKQGLLLLADGLFAALSLWIATVLRFEGDIIEPYRTTLPAFGFLLASMRIVVNAGFRLHRWSFRFSGLADAARIGMASSVGTILFMTVFYLLREPGPPRSVVALELLITTALMTAIRFGPRLASLYFGDWIRGRNEDLVRTLIVGAGAAGEMLLRDLQRSGAHRYHVLGFVDDDKRKWNSVVGGRTVLGPISDLPRISKRSKIDQVLIAIPLLQGHRIREILSTCAELKLGFKILPVSFVYLNERASSSMLKDLQPADLLQREMVQLSQEDFVGRLEGRTTLVTGAAGSIGSEICRQLLASRVGLLVMVDVNENDLYLGKRRLEKEFPDTKLVVEIASIRDAGRMDRLFQRYRPQDVFHAAAHKHVPLMEAAPCEAVKNNIQGTRIVAEAAERHRADLFVMISTDKAVRPTSVMGATKRVAEMIVSDLDIRGNTEFCAVRFGNVLGSAGSVVPLFREQIAAGGPVSVTHPDVRRFFMTISEAVTLVLQAAYSNYGALCVLDMGEQIRIVDLARHMITMAGHVPDVDIPIEFTGLRPGEKLYEELLTEEEVQTRRVTQKIFAADCPPPPDNLGRSIEELESAAADEDEDRVIRLLYKLVPSYTPERLNVPAKPIVPPSPNAEIS